MVFSWSTPLRQNGHTSLPLIPNEIYLAIFECIAPNIHTFSALALVCRFFCSVALPRVFERVTFPGNLYYRAEASRKTNWAREIVANTESSKSIALYVKKCTFENWSFNAHSQWGEFTFATLYCQAMARMSNIRELKFHKVFVKTEHWDAMAELKQLDVLELYYCSFIEDPPDKALTVRAVKIWDEDPIPFTLRPIATTTLRSLEISEVEVVQKLVAFRQLAIDDLIIENPSFDIEVLVDVFQPHPDLKSVYFMLKREEMISPLVATLSPKKLFTRLRSFAIVGYGFHLERDEMEMLISDICDGPGTLPSLEELTFSVATAGGWGRTLDVISECLNGTIIPAFPNLRCITGGWGDYMSLEEGNWEVHYSGATKRMFEHENNRKLRACEECTP